MKLLLKIVVIGTHTDFQFKKCVDVCLTIVLVFSQPLCTPHALFQVSFDKWTYTQTSGCKPISKEIQQLRKVSNYVKENEK